MHPARGLPAELFVLVETFVMTGKEKVHQGRDILATLTQGWQCDVDDLQEVRINRMNRILASLLNRLGPGREFTVRITSASVKNTARFGSFFTDIPAASFGGAFYSHTEGHGVFAFRVSRAG